MVENDITNICKRFAAYIFSPVQYICYENENLSGGSHFSDIFGGSVSVGKDRKSTSIAIIFSKTLSAAAALNSDPRTTRLSPAVFFSRRLPPLLHRPS